MNTEVIKRIGSIIGRVLYTLLLTVCLFYVICMLLPKVIGMDTGIVKSGSMEPAIPTGSMVYMKEQSLDTIKEDDVIAFALGDTVVIHRVIGYDQEGKRFVTKGDNNEEADVAPVSFEQVKGKVMFHIPWLGYVHTWLQRYKVSIGIGVVLGCSVYFLIKYVGKKINKEKKNE